MRPKIYNVTTVDVQSFKTIGLPSDFSLSHFMLALLRAISAISALQKHSKLCRIFPVEPRPEMKTILASLERISLTGILLFQLSESF